MFKKLRLKIAKAIPFLKWIAKDLENGNTTGAKKKIETEFDETVKEIRAEIKGIK
jgi:hypothetical protein